MKIKIKIVISLLVLILLGTVIINQKIYFFNRLTFKQDEVTYLPWSWYKSPLEIDYYKKENDTDKFLLVKDKEEVELIFNEIKKSQVVDDYVPLTKPLADYFDVIIIRGDDGANLLHLKGYVGDEIIRVKTGRDFYIKSTDRLQDLLQKRLSQTKLSK